MTAAPDPLRWVAFLEESKKGLTNETHLAMVDVFIEYLIAETSNDLERTMATLHEDVCYHVWGSVPPFADEEEQNNSADPREQVRTFYATGMSSPAGFPQFELETHRFFVGDDGLAMDGIILAPRSGAELEAMGYDVPPGSTGDDDFVTKQRLALFIPFRDGLMLGEDMYWDGNVTIEKVDLAQIGT